MMPIWIEDEGILDQLMPTNNTPQSTNKAELSWRAVFDNMAIDFRRVYPKRFIVNFGGGR